MERPPVSVALASYEGAVHIGAQVASILRQTVVPDEIVLADDGSRDGTVDAVVEVVAASGSDVELRIVSRERVGGVVANFERALRAARHPVVVLSDQDDLWHPDRVEAALARFAERPDLLLVHSDARLVGEDGAELGSAFAAIGYGPAEWEAVRGGHAFEVLLRRNVVTGATAMMRRDLIERALPVPDGWVHDEWLATVAAASDGLDVIERPLIDYRQHGGNEIGLAELSLRGKVGRMLEPGRERNARLLLRAESLAARAASGTLPLDERRRGEVAEKLEHERMRSALPSNRTLRVASIARAIREGRYRRFGRGAADAMRDLLQPL